MLGLCLSLPELASVTKNLVKNDHATLPLLPTFGVKENGYFNSSKTPESRLASSAGGREDPKPSLLLKLHRLCKGPNTTK
jgi:hypothetical protein